jgi:RNA polymerase sigma factor (sigma-70 family)
MTTADRVDVSPDDAGLMLRSHTDPEAFAPIFERHAVAVHAFLARRSCAELADDLLSEVFAIAFDGRRRYDGSHASARPWLYGIAHNLLRARLRTDRRRRGLLHRVPVESSTHPWDDVDRRLDAHGPGVQAAAALANLPAGERDVVQLVAWEDLKLTEVAVILQIPVGTARSRLHRARAALKAALSSETVTGQPVSPHHTNGGAS